MLPRPAETAGAPAAAAEVKGTTAAGDHDDDVDEGMESGEGAHDSAFSTEETTAADAKAVEDVIGSSSGGDLRALPRKELETLILQNSCMKPSFVSKLRRWNLMKVLCELANKAVMTNTAPELHKFSRLSSDNPGGLADFFDEDMDENENGEEPEGSGPNEDDDDGMQAERECCEEQGICDDN